ncbi:hypothetical protein R6Q59_027311, partial [Mikania micrantha]
MYIIGMYNAISVVIFHLSWKMQSDVWGGLSDQEVGTHITEGNFAKSSITINGWLRDFLWAHASQILEFGKKIETVMMKGNGHFWVPTGFGSGFGRVHVKPVSVLICLKYRTRLYLSVRLNLYVVVVDPIWFYLHVTCQTSAYVIGVAGWANGIQLGGQSSGIRFKSHIIIGIILFCVAILQVILLLVRPKYDHKYRIYWNIYHHSLGYGIILLGIINIFKGFDILKPQKKWKRWYSGIII